MQFAPLVQLYKKAALNAGHDVSQLQVGSHSIGFVGENTERAADTFFPSLSHGMNKSAKSGAGRITIALATMLPAALKVHCM